MKMQPLFDTLSASMVGRDGDIKAIMRALVAHEHVFLHGEPGTGKSFLLNNFARATGADCFRTLLTRHSTPEELFGPLRLTKLKEDEYVRNTTDRLPEAWFAFIDEIFKASGAIINNLLSIMQERIFDNGGRTMQCPLRCLVAASNEFPEAGELDAVYDRFLVRRNVKYVPKHMRRRLMFAPLAGVQQAVVTTDEIDDAHIEAMDIPFSPEAADSFLEIWETLETDGVKVGDRRAGKARKIAQAEAWLQGDTVVKQYHLECLTDVFWSRLDDLKKVEDIVIRLSNPDEMVLNEWVEFLDELKDKRLKSHETNDASSAAARLDSILTVVAKMAPSPKAIAVQTEAANMLDSMRAIITGQSSDSLRRVRLAREALKRMQATAN